jgi:hypothetical protein
VASDRLQGSPWAVSDRRLGLVRTRWFALVRNDQTPIVYLNIAVHESGHVLFRPFGELTMLIMGSGFEVLFPFAAGVVFLWRRRDVVASAVYRGRAASALASAATYIADADDGRLALLGATGPDAAGDRERILGQEFFDKVYLPTRSPEPSGPSGTFSGSRLSASPRWRSCGTAGGNGLRSRSPGPVNRDAEVAASRAGRRTDVAVAASIGSLPELEYDAPASDRGSSPWLEAPS